MSCSSLNNILYRLNKLEKSSKTPGPPGPPGPVVLGPNSFCYKFYPGVDGVVGSGKLGLNSNNSQFASKLYLNPSDCNGNSIVNFLTGVSSGKCNLVSEKDSTKVIYYTITGSTENSNGYVLDITYTSGRAGDVFTSDETVIFSLGDTPGEATIPSVLTVSQLNPLNEDSKIGSTGNKFKEVWTKELYVDASTIHFSNGVDLSANSSGELIVGIDGSSTTIGGSGTVGPAGPAGAQGAQGAAGPAGAQGPSGADGLRGATGADGLKGATGADGLRGATGADGKDGGEYYPNKNNQPPLVIPSASGLYSTEIDVTACGFTNGNIGDIFNKIINDANGVFSTGYINGSPTGNCSLGGVTGSWIKISLKDTSSSTGSGALVGKNEKLCIYGYSIARNVNSLDSGPKEVVFMGSIDNINWNIINDSTFISNGSTGSTGPNLKYGTTSGYVKFSDVIGSLSNAGSALTETGSVGNNIISTYESEKAYNYKYYALVVKSAIGSSSNQVKITEIEFYGYKETLRGSTRSLLSVKNELRVGNYGEKMLVKEDGRVGIGTNNPDSALHIYNYGTVDTKIHLEAGDGNNRAGNFIKTGGVSGGVDSFNNLIFGMSNNAGHGGPIIDTEFMRINGFGHVGIGTNNPDSALHVVGNIVANGSGFFQGGDINNVTGPPGVALGTNVDKDGNIQITSNTDQGGWIDWTHNTGSTDYLGRIRYHKNNGFQITSSIGKVGVNVDEPQQLLHVGVNNGTSLVTNGSVGIGTTTPTEKLEVNGNAVVNGDIKGNVFRGSTYLFNSPGDTDGGLFSTQDGHISIKTNGQNAIYVDNTQRVGIGTETPESALHIVGERSNMPSQAGIHMGKTSTDYAIEIVGETDGLAYIDFSVLGDNGGTSSSNRDFGARIIYTPSDTTGEGYLNLIAPKVKVNGADTTSDDRLKHNEVAVTGALGVINKVDVFNYDKTTEFLDIDHTGPVDIPHRKETGVIAQELYEIDELKHTVSVGDEKNAWSVNYNGLFSYAVAAIKELHAEVKSLKSKIAVLEESKSGSEETKDGSEETKSGSEEVKSEGE